MRNYLTIAEISEQVGIPNSTCRRYLTSFETFFIVKGGSRLKKYEQQAVDVLKRIKQLYEDGQDTNEIHSVLVNEFPLVINGDEQQEGTNKQQTAVSTLATSEDITEIKTALEQQRQFSEQQQEFNKMLLQKLNEQNEYIKESLERRDQQLLESIRQLQEQKQQAQLEVATSQHKRGFFSRLFNK